MRHDIDAQEYRDFGENLGKYRPGVANISVYKKDGTSSGQLAFPMPDFSPAASQGMATLVAPSYLASVKHNGGYTSVAFGNGAQFSTTYLLVNKNNYDADDFHAPRLNKVATDVVPTAYVSKRDYLANYRARYTLYTRVGAGTQVQVNDTQTARVELSGAYNWKTGGTLSTENIRSRSTNSSLRYVNLGPNDAHTTPLSIGAMPGDSGSPVFAWDSIAQKWLLISVHGGSQGDSAPYNKLAYTIPIPDGFIELTQAKNTSPDVTDSSEGGAVSWSAAEVSQSGQRWSWQGLADGFKSQAPSAATLAELDATKDLRFNGAGNTIELLDAINMGAGKLQFSQNYILTSASGVAATWVGGGVEVDAGKSVIWQVNGLAGDALHKIGDGTLHVKATGSNPGRLNVGAGTVILEQQADAAGSKQAFSDVTLVSGRPTVVLADAQQVSADNIRFGYRGGTLDLNGNDLAFEKIKHTDDGARLVNHDASRAASITLTGDDADTIPLRSWAASRRGVVDDIYQYNNPYSHRTEYFRLKTASYGYFPGSGGSNSAWEFLGTDLNPIQTARLEVLNNSVFRGYIGETDDDKPNGELNVIINNHNQTAKTTLAGGMDLNGELRVVKGTTLLSGQPVPHAGSVVIDDDWNFSAFKARKITVNDGETFQVGEYAGVEADVAAGASSRLMFGYNDSANDRDKIWRCYTIINKENASCSQPTRSEEALAALPHSLVTGDVSLDDEASLYLGKVLYLGNVTSADRTTVTLDPTARWTLRGNSSTGTLRAQSGSRISMLPDGEWSPKTLTVDTLDATGMTLSLGVKPTTEESDRLNIRKEALGGSNVLDVSLMLDPTQSVSLLSDLVMVDAPSGTAHGYFTLPDVLQGFSVYSPNYEVKESESRVQWILRHNTVLTPPEAVVVPTNEPAPELPAGTTVARPGKSPPMEPGDPLPGDAPDNTVPVDPALLADGEPIRPLTTEPTEPTPAETPVEPEPEPAQPAEPEPPRAVKPFAPEEWFTIKGNAPLIQRTRALLASRQYLFNETLSGMNSRAALLRAVPERSGQWATVDQSRGRWEGLTLTQSTLNLGWDTVGDGQMFGLNAGYSQGKTTGEGQVKHRLFSAGAEYSWSSPPGWFVDVSGRYLHLSQDFSVDRSLQINDTTSRSNMLAADVKSGFDFHFANRTLTLTPYVAIGAGIMPGYTLKGEDAQIALGSSRPLSATGGLELRKSGLWAGRPDIALTTGVAYQYAPGKSGSELTLTDRHASRHYDAWSDNRYRLYAGLEGMLAPNLALEAKVKSSVDGRFTTDYSGMLGIGYRF